MYSLYIAYICLHYICSNILQPPYYVHISMASYAINMLYAIPWWGYYEVAFHRSTEFTQDFVLRAVSSKGETLRYAAGWHCDTEVALSAIRKVLGDGFHVQTEAFKHLRCGGQLGKAYTFSSLSLG